MYIGPDLKLTTPGSVFRIMADSPTTVLVAPPTPRPSSQEEIVADPGTDTGPNSLCPSGESLSPPVEHSHNGKKDLAEAASVADLSVLHVLQIPLSCNYGILSKCFSCYGVVKEIRMRFVDNENSWEAWLLYSSHEAALKACSSLPTVEVCGSDVTGALCASAPCDLDVYVPALYTPEKKVDLLSRQKRAPSPPMWLVATAQEDNYNYFKFCRYLQSKVGGINSGDITRFGKAKVLVHAKSKTQSLMLSHLRAESGEMLKEVKPHMDFSYGRGVVFDKDLYEFDEGEILDMCPTEVFHVKKLRGTSMIVLTFNCPDSPSHIIIENERISVRPFKRKPLQCFNCYKFGHPSTTCREAPLCPECSSPVHGACTDDPKCINCGQGHKSRDKDCPSYKAEEAALRKSKAEHISVQYAKRLLGHSRTYSQVVRKQPVRSKAQQPSASSRDSPVVSKVQQPSTSSSGSSVMSVGRPEQASAAEAAPSRSSTPHSHHTTSLPVS